LSLEFRVEALEAQVKLLMKIAGLGK
jgi:hypothetical protein